MRALEVHWQCGIDEPIVLGHLAETRAGTFFEFSPEALTRGLNPSPLKLPPGGGTKRGPSEPFNGLHGLFNDSLPDGFGARLLDNWIRRQDKDPLTASRLDRLAIIGSRSMGALSYHPPAGPREEEFHWDLTAAESEIHWAAEGKSAHILNELVLAGGSPQGARPKLLVALSRDGKTAISGLRVAPGGFVHSLVKFPAVNRDDTESRFEEVYARMARAAGISMPPTRLLELDNGRVVFAVDRFDRQGNTPIHMHSVCGLLEVDHHVPGLDYEGLLRLARMLTRSQADVEALFRLAVFNVLAHNRDDHVKNFAFLQLPSGAWRLAPGYDLNYSRGPGGEHTTTVLGRGRDISEEALEELAQDASISLATARRTIEQVKTALAQFQQFAKEVDAPRRETADILKVIAPAKHVRSR